MAAAEPNSSDYSPLGKRVASYFPQPDPLRDRVVLMGCVTVLGIWVMSQSIASNPNVAMLIGSAALIVAGLVGVLRSWQRQSRRVHMHQRGFEFVQGETRQEFLWDDVCDVWQIPVYSKSGEPDAPHGWTVRIQTIEGRKLTLDGFEGGREIARRTQNAISSRLIEHYRQAFESGSWVRFGKKLAVSDEGLNVGLKPISWYEISDIFLDEEDGVRIGHCQESTAWIHLPIGSIANFQLLTQLLSWVKANQSLTVEDAERSVSDSRSVGLFETPNEVDASELAASGFEWDEIDDVMNGECTVDELLERGPRKRPRVPK